MIDAASSSLTLDASVRQALVFRMAAALAVIKLNVEQKGLRECSRNWALFVSCTRHTIWKRASDDSEWGRVGKKGKKKKRNIEATITEEHRTQGPAYVPAGL